MVDQKTYLKRVPLQERRNFVPSAEPRLRFSAEGTYATSAFRPRGWVGAELQSGALAAAGRRRVLVAVVAVARVPRGE
jgi:hypothetical protein